MVFIYVLELENKKYYIGKTNNPKFRLDQHFNLNGSLSKKSTDFFDKVAIKFSKRKLNRFQSN